MSLFFKPPKIRRFHHEMIYYDERKDRLKQIEQRARRDLEFDQSADQPPVSQARPSFSFRRSSYPRRTSFLPKLLFLIVVLLLVFMGAWFL